MSKPYRIVEKFKIFYKEAHAGICAECFFSSTDQLIHDEPMWFSHVDCADAFRIAREVFVKEMIAVGENVHA